MTNVNQKSFNEDIDCHDQDFIISPINNNNTTQAGLSFGPSHAASVHLPTATPSVNNSVSNGTSTISLNNNNNTTQAGLFFGPSHAASLHLTTATPSVNNSVSYGTSTISLHNNNNTTQAGLSFGPSHAASVHLPTATPSVNDSVSNGTSTISLNNNNNTTQAGLFFGPSHAASVHLPTVTTTTTTTNSLRGPKIVADQQIKKPRKECASKKLNALHVLLEEDDTEEPLLPISTTISQNTPRVGSSFGQLSSTSSSSLTTITPNVNNISSATSIVRQNLTSTPTSASATPAPQVSSFYQQRLSSSDVISVPTSLQNETTVEEQLTGINTKTRLYRLLLTGDSKGRSILTSARNRLLNTDKTKRFLLSQTRNQITRFIIQYELNKKVKDLPENSVLDEFKLTSDQLKAWANEVVQTFRGENVETYYRPFYVNDLGEQINAGGKLFFHYHYTVGTLRASGLLRIKNQINKILDTEISQSTSEKLVRLGFLLDPWSEVIDLWTDTWLSRQNNFKHTELTVNEYVNQFACLRVNKAVELYEIDFQLLYPDHTTLFVRRWNKAKDYLFNKIQSLKNIKEPSDIALIQVYPTLSADGQDAVLFHLLPYLIPSGNCSQINNQKKSRKKNQKKADQENFDSANLSNVNSQSKQGIKYSLQERRDGFCVHLQSAINVQEILDATKRRTKTLNHQPVPVVIGAITQPADTYVILSDTVYQINSCLKAVDLNLKICFATSCHYPTSSYSLWLFIQQAFFNITTPLDKVSNALGALIGEVKTILDN